MILGLALSGGGARGIAHLGMLKALEEAGISPAMLSGASAGAILGAFYAAGFSPEAILEIIEKTNLIKYMRPAMSIAGLLNLEKAEPIFKDYFPENTFESLKLKLIVSATDVEKGKSVFFSRGELIKPVLASSCIPVIFKPLKIGNAIYIDGGILNNLPVEPLEGHCDRIIGMHCNPVNDTFNPGNMKDILEKSLLMAINYNAYQRKNQCDLFLEPPEMKAFKVFDFKKSRQIFEIGYNYACQQMDHIQSLFKQENDFHKAR